MLKRKSVPLLFCHTTYTKYSMVYGLVGEKQSHYRMQMITVGSQSLTPVPASHKPKPSSVPWGIADSYSALPCVTWEAVTVVGGIS